ncbi:hypothetical protein POM88_008968 [Heracleum sosnowskyi]|uniref:Uncharacterized protein n=1 Tax=Heracleum sosnowskyi TaxID=360622 RepID=A0AAD8N264_9APIA|nr:hypothetical protein POM88_008968 [Heracleum sosnowskyi]
MKQITKEKPKNRKIDILSSTVNFETSFMKEHNPGQPKQASVHHKLTRQWTPQCHLDEKTESMKDRVCAQKVLNTINPLTPTTPRGTAGKKQHKGKENICAQQSRIKEAAFNNFGSGSLPPSCKQGPLQVAKEPRRKGPAIQKRKNHSTPMFNDPTISTPKYRNETRNKWKKAIVSDDSADSDASDLFSDNDFYDDCDEEFYEFQKNGRIGSNIDKGKQPIDIPPRTLDFNELEREGNTSDYQPDIDYSYVADMLSDQSDGDSEDEAVQHDVDYDAYDMLKTTTNGNYLFLHLQ